MTAPPKVDDYLDYRAFLRDWFDARKTANPRFSHRLFARLASQKSPSLLLHVVDGRRNLTSSTREAFAKAMKLTAREGRVFADLVALDQAETDAERAEAWQRIRADRRFRGARRIEGEAFDCLSHWYYTAIHELANRRDFRAEPAWIARQLRPQITTDEARRALEALVSLGLLVQGEDGHHTTADASLTTPHQVTGLAVHNYHRDMSRRAHDAVTDFSAEERHMLGLTVSIPARLVPELKAELNAVQARLLDLCDAADGPAEQVFQLNLQLFPLSTGPES